MGIGVGIFLTVVGLILMFAVDVNIPGIEDNTLGLILVIAGIAGIVLGMIASRNAGRTRTVEERHVQ
jgi:ABC-type antimicrobial peptide transport system permease subunit